MICSLVFVSPSFCWSFPAILFSVFLSSGDIFMVVIGIYFTVYGIFVRVFIFYVPGVTLINMVSIMGIMRISKWLQELK